MSEEVRRDIFGTVRYYNKEGQLHRLDGPAVEWSDGYKAWYQNGKLHRLDGPAIEYSSGTKEWWQNGKYHRLDGPAYEGSKGHKEWYLEGKHYKTEKEWEAVVCPSIEEAAAMFKEVQA